MPGPAAGRAPALSQGVVQEESLAPGALACASHPLCSAWVMAAEDFTHVVLLGREWGRAYIRTTRDERWWEP